MTAAARPRPTGILWRLTGLVADLLLLALFLACGWLALNILITGVVLVVGAFTEPDARVAWAGREVARVVRDGADFGIAVVSFVGAMVVYWLYLRARRRFLHLFADPGFERFVSKRYLFAREGGRLVALISTVSILGVAVGVGALIVVISVMEGFDRELFRKFMGVFSHVEVAPHPMYARSRLIEGDLYRQLIREFEQHPDVIGVSPILSTETLLQVRAGASEFKAPAQIRGFDTARERNVTEFMNYVIRGKNEPGDREVVLGKVLARRLGVDVGDSVMAIGKLVADANRTAAKQSRLEVVGIFDSGLYDVDDKFAFTNLETIQNLLVAGDVASAIHIKTRDPQQVARIAAELSVKFPRGYYARTWQELNPQFFEALWMEKVAMFIILLLIVLVASLNIIGTLVMTVVQKTRDIGILKSMGASNGSILRIFLLHGSLIGLVGTSLGVVWGLQLCRFVMNDIDKIFQLPPGVYGLNRLPVVVDGWLILFLASCALVICILASIIPAYQAGRLHPVEALRYD
jgi:lipoprotein-releasing system permease protein